jgi:hypothetical protein
MATMLHAMLPASCCLLAAACRQLFSDVHGALAARQEAAAEPADGDAND